MKINIKMGILYQGEKLYKNKKLYKNENIL